MSDLDPEVAWFVPVCGCGWRGAPCRTSEDIAAEPAECPVCGGGLAAEIRKGGYRTFSRTRVAALRERRLG